MGKKDEKDSKPTSSAEQSTLDVVDEDQAAIEKLPENEREILIKHIDDPTNSTSTVPYRQILSYATKTEMLAQIAGVIAAAATGVALPSISLVFRDLINQFNDFATGNIAPETLTELSNKTNLYFVYIGIGVFGTTIIYMGTFSITSERITSRIRSAYLESLLHQNIAYYEKLGSGTVVDRIESQTLLLQEGLGMKIPQLFNYAATFLAAFIIAFSIDWRLTLVTSAIIPFILIAGSFFTIATNKYEALTLTATTSSSSIAEEALASIRTVFSFGSQKKLTSMYEKTAQDASKWTKYLAIWTGGSMTIFWFTSYVAYALAFWFGSIMIDRGHSVVGNVFAVYFLVTMGTFVFAMAPPLVSGILTGKAAAAKIIPTINRKPPVDSRINGKIPPDGKVDGLIELKNIKFLYPSRPTVTVLPDFSVTFPPGKTSALVGASGSGKSTVVGMLLRFYEPLEGQISLDGVDIKDLDLKWLRNQIGYVMQEPQLFSTSIRKNVEFGLVGSQFENYSDAEKEKLVIEACKQANADTFISTLPNKYDTEVGDKGFLLSGGQKQRIAIARAIIRDPKILLLDEATSALDTRSEVLVQEALDRASSGRTTIMIAHRLSTIKKADNIVVMSKGTISEQGTHDELIAAGGAYYNLVQAQRFEKGGKDSKGRFDDDQEDSHSGTDMDDTAVSHTNKIDDAKLLDAIELEKKQSGLGRFRSGSQSSKSRKSIDLEKGGDVEDKETKKKKKDTPTYSIFTILKRFWNLNKQDWLVYIFAILGCATVGMTYPVVAIIFGTGIENFVYTGREMRERSNTTALHFFLVALVGGIACGIACFCWMWSGANLVKKLKMASFHSLLRSDVEYFDRDENSSGSLTAKLSEAPSKIKGFSGQTAMSIVQNMVTMIGGIITSIAYGWKLALVATACIPLLISTGLTQLYAFELKEQKTKKFHSKSSAIACEAATAIRTVAALTLEDKTGHQYKNVLTDVFNVTVRNTVWGSLSYSIGQALAYFVMALIFWYGSKLLASGEYTQRQFFIVLMSVIFAAMDVGYIFAYSPDMSKTKSASRQLLTMMDNVPKIDPEQKDGRDLPADVKGHLRFEDVHFAYPTRPGARVLRGITIDAKPGSYIALVGPSGCGKSSTIQLAERFYDVGKGRITLDGVDVRDMNVTSYRSCIGLVSQEPTLYSGTVKFNVTFGADDPDKEISQEEIEEACKAANIHDFILTLPDGYDTDVGGKGVSLSGGQKQRMAIARALLRKPKILLLDEATSALDSQSERVVQETLDSAAAGRTTIAIAHRLSTIQKADKIYVYDNGRIVEQGTHSELTELNGLYSELVKQQELDREA